MSTKKKKSYILILLIFSVVVVSCTKIDRNEILGTWISTDKSDTLEFVDNSNFYKSSERMRHDHYDYQLDKDFIEIRYSGVLMILVQPTKHEYNLGENRLTIDFRNKICFGFSSTEMTFIRQ